MQIGNLHLASRLILSIFVGLGIGFVLPPLSTHTHYAHKGYSLYNVGFSAGIIATVIVSLMKSFGISIESRLIWFEGDNELFARLLLFLFFGMIIFAFLLSENVGKRYLEILKTYGLSGTDYVKSEGFAPTLLNMGINGIVATLILVMLGGALNGPTIGGIFTIVGFSATGKHLRNMIIFAFLLSENVGRRYLDILKTYGLSGTDYVKSEGFAPTLLNMGINGVMSTLILVMIGGALNGPTIGGIFTIVGFSATGKHIRNIFPIMMGVILGGLVQNWSITDPSALLALLLSTTLAPIAGEFGVLAGIMAGFLHSAAALNVGIVYGGMNLYNNGFAGGLIATFLVPVYQSVRDRRARAKVHDSL